MQIKNNWITGFVDGDGCFAIQKYKLKSNAFYIRHKFIVSQNKRSVDVLYALKKKFKCGGVYKSGGDMYEFTVCDKKSLLNVIIPFFIKYPLMSEKRKNFYKFVESLNDKQDNIYYKNFYNIQTKDFFFNLDADWVAGFIDADGCFYVSIVNNYPRPKLFVAIAKRDLNLLVHLKKFLTCGHVTTRKNCYMFTVSSIKHFTEFIFPRLCTKSNRNLLKTTKRLDFQKFKKIVFYMSEKKHLTEDGMEKIKKLKTSMRKNLASQV